jgi:ribosomal protein L17
MAVADSVILQRLRREESVAEQQGRQAFNISVMLKDFPQYALARQKADALLAKASELREQIEKIETQGRGSADLVENNAERGDQMAVADSVTLQRLRREESVSERQGRQALSISVMLKDSPQYALARQKADALLAKASGLREQIEKIETT